MSGSMYPEKECFSSRSHFTGTTGSWVDMSNFVGRAGSFFVNVPPALGAAVTVTFETADPDAANSCNADAATVAAMQTGGGFGETKTPLQIVIDPTNTALYSTTKGQVCRVALECRSGFVRAKLSAATPGLTVDVIGKAARLASIA